MSNYTRFTVWNEKVWICTFIPHFTGHVIYLSMWGLELIHVSKRGHVQRPIGQVVRVVIIGIFNLAFHHLDEALPLT